jgi:hypothetical protein
METRHDEQFVLLLSLSTPYSLGKLIEWKQTYNASVILQRLPKIIDSLLVREINWMETLGCNPWIQKSLTSAPYSLGKLIEWKRD